jgi:hypothetical protein
MSAAVLKPGDRVYFIGRTGLKLRGVIPDHLNLKTRGEDHLVPVQRPRKARKSVVNADRPLHPAREIKTRWLPRGAVRKLPV